MNRPAPFKSGKKDQREKYANNVRGICDTQSGKGCPLLTEILWPLHTQLAPSHTVGEKETIIRLGAFRSGLSVQEADFHLFAAGKTDGHSLRSRPPFVCETEKDEKYFSQFSAWEKMSFDSGCVLYRDYRVFIYIGPPSRPLLKSAPGQVSRLTHLTGGK